MRALLAVAAVLLAGCAAPASTLPPAGDLPPVPPDPVWFDRDLAFPYHDLDAVHARIDGYAAARPDLVRVVEIGASVEGRPILAVVIANPDVPGPKPAPFYDGGHHANEVEGVEATLYLVEFLLENYDRNATVRALVDAHETWVVPLVNPDGYVAVTRHNARGVNLNRNYDLDWGNPGGRNTREPVGGVLCRTLFCFENSGTGPFSEPESAAIRDAVTSLGDRLAFYVSHHTGVTCITRPWTATLPPFDVPAEESAVLDSVLDWVTRNSDVYHGGTWKTGTGTCMNYDASGTSQDWVYATFRVPAFTFEVADYGDDHPGLLAYMEAALPVNLFLLANAADLQAWTTPTADPPVP